MRDTDIQCRPGSYVFGQANRLYYFGILRQMFAKHSIQFFCQRAVANYHKIICHDGLIQNTLNRLIKILRFFFCIYRHQNRIFHHSAPAFAKEQLYTCGTHRDSNPSVLHIQANACDLFRQRADFILNTDSDKNKTRPTILSFDKSKARLKNRYVLSPEALMSPGQILFEISDT